VECAAFHPYIRKKAKTEEIQRTQMLLVWHFVSW